MVSAVRRMNALKALLGVRFGPGGAVLPSEIARIHMEFAHRNENGHMGARKFWRENLTRLKFWNPGVPMIVNRTNDNSRPATMSIYFRVASSPGTPDHLEPSSFSVLSADSQQMAASRTDGTSKAPPPGQNERVVTIDMTNHHSDLILSNFMSMTGAVPVAPTPEEQAELAEVEALRKEGDADRAIMRAHMDSVNAEKALLERARAEAAAMKAAN